MKKLIFTAALFAAALAANAQSSTYGSPYYPKSPKQSWQPETTNWQDPNSYNLQPQQYNQNKGYDVYQYNSYGTPQKTGYTENNYNGGYDVYKYNQYGTPVKVETIEPR